MLSISTDLIREIADQSPAALAVTLTTVAIDRSLRSNTSLLSCFRPGWNREDRSDDPVLMAAFPYDREFTGSDQTILLHTNAEHDFSLLTVQLSGETEVECLIVGEGFALVTRDLLRAGWCDWSECDAAPMPIETIRQAIGR